MASTEKNFFFPHSCLFSWTSNECEEIGAGSSNSNVEKLITQQHAVQFDPKNKVMRIDVV